MYLSEERVAIANRAIHETFEQTCVAWQVIPHWDTGDPAQTTVRNDNPTSPGFVQMVPVTVEFYVTLAEAISPTPDALLAKVMATTVKLAGKIDRAVFPDLRAATALEVKVGSAKPSSILKGLIVARALVENAGYRAPSCLIADLKLTIKLNRLLGGYSVKESLLDAGSVNSLHRVKRIKYPTFAPDTAHGLFLGRRQRIAHGDVMDASPGEEPVDLAVSVAPSLEVVGDTPTNDVKLRVRITYATRVKDARGIVVIVEK